MPCARYLHPKALMQASAKASGSRRQVFVSRFPKWSPLDVAADSEALVSEQCYPAVLTRLPQRVGGTLVRRATSICRSLRATRAVPPSAWSVVCGPLPLIFCHRQRRWHVWNEPYISCKLGFSYGPSLLVAKADTCNFSGCGKRVCNFTELVLGLESEKSTQGSTEIFYQCERPFTITKDHFVCSGVGADRAAFGSDWRHWSCLFFHFAYEGVAILVTIQSTALGTWYKIDLFKSPFGITSWAYRRSAIEHDILQTYLRSRLKC